MKNKKKAQVWISAILYILIISASIVLILKVGIPILDKMKDKSNFQKAKDSMLALDKTIREVADEGEGSQRIIPVDISDGKLIVEGNDIIWELKTKTEVVDERTNINYGNMVISSNANVKTWENNDSYTMQTSIEEDIFNVTIIKAGSPDNFTQINTTDLIKSVYYSGEKLNGTFNFKVNDDPLSETGDGYVIMSPSGNNSNLGFAKVTAHINSSTFEYDLVFTLESFADFITVELKNVKEN